MNELNLNYIKGGITAIFAALSAMLGVLYIPVVLLVVCNVIDYITGLLAAPYRKKDTGEQGVIDSTTGLKGIVKKVMMWLLVVVGAVLDALLAYAVTSLGVEVPFDFFISCVVAMWLICNELISILENVADAGVAVPSFLMPIIKNLKNQTENKFEKEESEEKK